MDRKELMKDLSKVISKKTVEGLDNETRMIADGVGATFEKFSELNPNLKREDLLQSSFRNVLELGILIGTKQRFIAEERLLKGILDDD